MPRASDLVKEMNKKSVDFDRIMILCCFVCFNVGIIFMSIKYTICDINCIQSQRILIKVI